jgi:phage N-6-adenine-methyltransferase
VIAPSLFSTGRDDWETPPDLFLRLYEEFEFVLDVAANERNHKTLFWLGPGGVCDDALVVPWATNGPCWCNPPYSRGRQAAFIAKASFERLRGVTTVMLLPARTDTKVFHDHIWDRYSHKTKGGIEMRLLKGRLRFVGALSSAPFPSMIVVFRAETGDAL